MRRQYLPRFLAGPWLPPGTQVPAPPRRRDVWTFLHAREQHVTCPLSARFLCSDTYDRNAKAQTEQTSVTCRDDLKHDHVQYWRLGSFGSRANALPHPRHAIGLRANKLRHPREQKMVCRTCEGARCNSFAQAADRTITSAPQRTTALARPAPPGACCRYPRRPCARGPGPPTSAFSRSEWRGGRDGARRRRWSRCHSTD